MPDLNNQRLAAIWARVSTDQQSETSLGSQVDRCKKKLETAGYIVPPSYIFSTDWTSLELDDSPQFQALEALIIGKKIGAVGIFDRDRLHADYIHRLAFMSLCKDNVVEIIIFQGPEFTDSDEGQLIEHILAIGKKKAVIRAQLGSKQGLHDRVTKYGKPVTFRQPYGYMWDKEKLTLIPDDNWQNVKLIFDLLLDGKGYGHVIDELKRLGIPSPSGQFEWNKTAISTLLHNPIYAGRYYGLKKEAHIPLKKRSPNTYGKSSLIKRDESEWIPLEKVIIQEPPITWEQREKLLDQVKVHMKLAQRNATHDYLLRGFIYCREHSGVNGAPRIYHGHPKRDTYYYCCPVPGCENRYLPGEALEEWVLYVLKDWLGHINDADPFGLSGRKADTERDIKSQLDKLGKKSETLIQKKVRLQDDYYSNKVDSQLYNRMRDKFEFESSGITNQQNDLIDKLAQLNRQNEAYQNLLAVWYRFKGLFSKDMEPDEMGEKPLTNSQWREIFSAINLKIRPNNKEDREKLILADVKLRGYTLQEIEDLKASKKFLPEYDISIYCEIPLEGARQRLSGIVLDSPGLDLHNKAVYPIHLTLNDFSTLAMPVK